MLSKKRLLGIGCIVGVGLIVAVAYGVDVSARHAWGKYHWERASNPVVLTLGDNFSNDENQKWTSAYNAAFADWTSSEVLELWKGDGGTSGGTCAATYGRIEVCAADYTDTGWLGIAQIWINGTHIVQATAKMNDFYFNQNSYDTSAWRRYVMCQEVGHDFGLGHQDENFDNTNLGSCMDYTSNPISNQQPNQHDYEQLEKIYKRLDGNGGGGATSRAKDRPGSARVRSQRLQPSTWSCRTADSGARRSPSRAMGGRRSSSRISETAT